MKMEKTKKAKICIGIACASALFLLVGCMNASQMTANAAKTELLYNSASQPSAPVETDAAVPPTDAIVPQTNAAVPPADAAVPLADAVTSRVLPESVTISLAGDCALGDLFGARDIEQTFDQNGPAYFFKNVKDIFANDDMTLVNLECVWTTSNERVKKLFNIKGRPEYNQILVEGAIDAVSFGNNHNMDYGIQSTEDTLNALHEMDMPFAINELRGIYETESGVRVGFVATNEFVESEAIRAETRRNVEMYLKSGIEWLKEQNVDLILACPHWGVEMAYYPNDYQKEMGRKCIDWGADLVVGCHPHVLQGLDKYNGKYIIYSLGNFSFGANRNPKDKDTMIVQATFPIADGVVSDDAQLKVIPCTISSVQNRNDYCPTVATGEKGAAIIQRLNEFSRPFNITIDAEGNVSQ